MTDIDPNSLRRQKELDIAALRAKSAALEKRMRELLQRIDGNSNYRNDIIWLAQEINKIQRQIKVLESDDTGRCI
ncbi:MAG: hypothetical protein JW901_12425 [Dehalococcoidia bacterium]|nr:hypothetical protein [Dehalococcoidia bacterium]